MMGMLERVISSCFNLLSLLMEGERVRELVEALGEMTSLVVLRGTPSRGKWSWK